MKRSAPLARHKPFPKGPGPQRRTRLKPGDWKRTATPTGTAAKLARSRIKPANPKRRAASFARAYGSEARVEWIQSLPCAVPGCHRAPSQNAHAVGGGMGRKADASTILPLCAQHHTEHDHDLGPRLFQSKYGLDTLAAAAAVDALWKRLTGEPDGD